MPFNEPTRAFVTSNGDLYVSDGYGQKRVHRFASDGTLLRSWGEEGTGPGQFGWPVHSVWVDSRGRVLIVDRQNGRVQHFTADGEYTGEWSDLLSPNDLYIDPNNIIFIAEGGRRVTIMTLDAEILSRWGEHGDEPGQFSASPHSCWVDSRGDIYIGEVVAHDRFQKFIRV
jgi:sugar lactone lactonase YvrE